MTMKSLSELGAALAERVAENPAGTALALSHRENPLGPADTEKIDRLIAECFDVKLEPFYGNVAKHDADGKYYGTEYDLIGYRHVYVERKSPGAKLCEAVLRPTTRDHAVAHLTRLAAHCRDTRGPQALALVISDIADDVRGVPEWAVIAACRELRAKASPWFPATGVVISAIRQAEILLRGLFGPRQQTPSAAIPVQPAAKGWNELPKPQWGAQHWADYAKNALNMAEMAKQNPSMFDLEFWVVETARRRNEAALAGFVPEEMA